MGTMQSSTPDSRFMISWFRVQRIHLISSTILRSCTTIWSNQIRLVCYPCMRSCLTLTIFSSPKSDLALKYINYHLSIRTLHYICAIYYHPISYSSLSKCKSKSKSKFSSHHHSLLTNTVQKKQHSLPLVKYHSPTPVIHTSPSSSLKPSPGRLTVTCWWSFGCSRGDFNFPSWCWCSGWFRWWEG